MTITSFEIDNDRQVVPIAPAEAARACQTPGARIWFDFEDVEPASLEGWLDKVGVTGFSRRQCLEANKRSVFYPLTQEALFAVPVMVDTGESREVDCLTMLCRENLLVTFHSRPMLGPGQLAVLRESAAWLQGRSIAGLVSAILIDLSQRTLRQTDDLRKSILALEGRIEAEPDAVDPEEILELRSELLTIGAVVGDQLPSVQALRATDKPYFKTTDAQDYLNCTLVNLQVADRLTNWLDGRITALRSGFQMHAQEKTNRRLNVLTILSAIFTPVTFLAGIWGMNFSAMPELGFSFGYPVALGLMALIGSGMYLFFRRNGWLD